MKSVRTFTIADIPNNLECARILYENISDSCRCDCGIPMDCTEKYVWCETCRKKESIKSGTWLSGSNITPRNLYILALAWQQKQSPGSVRLFTGLSYSTIQRWYTRFRDVLPEARAPLTGVVEVDESYFGKRSHKQVLVAGAIERGGRVKLAVINNRKRSSLLWFLLQNVSTGSTLLTDAHAGYIAAGRHYNHIVCNHSSGNYGGTSGIENMWSRGKRQMMRQYSRFVASHLGGLLKELEARHNHPELFLDPYRYIGHCFDYHLFVAIKASGYEIDFEW